MIRRLIVLSVVLLSGAAVLARASTQEPVPIRQSLTSFPMQLDGWQGRHGEPFDDTIMAVLGVDEYVNAGYVRAADLPIGLYVGYYQSQRQGDAIHSPLNCLPGAGWAPLSKSTASLTVSEPAAAGGTMVSRTIDVNRYVIEKGADRQMVLYWYQSHGRVIASEYTSKAYMILDAMRTNRTDAALVRVITVIPDGSAEATFAAERRASDFVKTLFPVLAAYIPS